MNEAEKRKRLREILPLAWNSYQHMYDVRVNRIQNTISFLLIIISFLSIASINFIYFENKFFFFPLIFQLFAFLFLLKGLRKVGLHVHWFKIEQVKNKLDDSKENLLDNLKEGIFEEDLLADLKAIEDDSWVYSEYTKKIIRKSLHLIFFSLYLSGFILIFIYFQGILRYLVISVLTLIYLCFYFWYKMSPKYKYSSNKRIYLNRIDEWIKSNPIS